MDWHVQFGCHEGVDESAGSQSVAQKELHSNIVCFGFGSVIFTW